MTRPRVLIADDQQPILDWLDQQLRDEFQIVAACTDGSTALESAIALQPDALVLDISMPQMSGLDVARRLSALPNPPRIVFLSVHEDRDFQEAATAAGGSGYVIKRAISARTWSPRSGAHCRTSAPKTGDGAAHHFLKGMRLTSSCAASRMMASRSDSDRA